MIPRVADPINKELEVPDEAEVLDVPEEQDMSDTQQGQEQMSDDETHVSFNLS